MSENMINEILKQIAVDSIFNDVFVKNFIDSFEYQGFNATKILSLVAGFLQSKNVGGKQQGSEDILKLIALGLYRGNRVSAMARTLRKQESDWLKSMIKEFSLVDKINDPKDKSAANVDKITLSRFRKALPQFAFKALRFSELQRQVSLSDVQQHFRIDTFPSGYRDMCIMSLLPKKTVGAFKEAHFYMIISYIFAYCFTETGILVDPSKKAKTEEERAKDVVKYMRISFNANHVTNAMRARIASDLIDASGYEDNKEKIEQDISIIQTKALNLGVDLSDSFILG